MRKKVTLYSFVIITLLFPLLVFFLVPLSLLAFSYTLPLPIINIIRYKKINKQTIILVVAVSLPLSCHQQIDFEQLSCCYCLRGWRWGLVSIKQKNRKNKTWENKWNFNIPLFPSHSRLCLYCEILSLLSFSSPSPLSPLSSLSLSCLLCTCGCPWFNNAIASFLSSSSCLFFCCSVSKYSSWAIK